MEDLFANPRWGDKIARSKEDDQEHRRFNRPGERRHAPSGGSVGVRHKVFSHSVNVMILRLALTERSLECIPISIWGMRGWDSCCTISAKADLPAILNKPGELNEEEWKLIRMHPNTAPPCQGNGSALAEVHAIVMEHHEKFVGGGYPSEKSGEHIHILAASAPWRTPSTP
jgi:hypothetical protein